VEKVPVFCGWYGADRASALIKSAGLKAGERPDWLAHRPQPGRA